MLDNHQAQNESGIRLTAESLAAAKQIQKEHPDWATLALRVYLEGKGCDGFYYGVTFDEVRSDDVHFPHDDLDVVVDPDSLTFCTGSTVEWCDDERGRGFLVENPNHSKFRGKFYKRKVWQDRLVNKKKQ